MNDATNLRRWMLTLIGVGGHRWELGVLAPTQSQAIRTGMRALGFRSTMQVDEVYADEVTEG